MEQWGSKSQSYCTEKLGRALFCCIWLLLIDFFKNLYSVSIVQWNLVIFDKF